MKMRNKKLLIHVVIVIVLILFNLDFTIFPASAANLNSEAIQAFCSSSQANQNCGTYHGHGDEVDPVSCGDRKNGSYPWTTVGPPVYTVVKNVGGTSCEATHISGKNGSAAQDFYGPSIVVDSVDPANWKNWDESSKQAAANLVNGVLDSNGDVQFKNSPPPPPPPTPDPTPSTPPTPDPTATPTPSKPPPTPDPSPSTPPPTPTPSKSPDDACAILHPETETPSTLLQAANLLASVLPQTPENMRLPTLISQMGGQGSLAGNLGLEIYSAAWQYFGIIAFIKFYKLIPGKMS